MAGSPFDGRFKLVTVSWIANPFRGDRLEEAWAPYAEMVTKYGAKAWAFIRSTDDPLTFLQVAVFEKKIDFERYWLSDEIAAARTSIGGMYQVPLLPIWHEAVTVGSISDTIAGANGANGAEEAA